MLIKEWRQALYMRSVQLLLLLLAGAEFWFSLPAEDQQFVLGLIPDVIERHFLSIVSLAVIVARLYRQGISGGSKHE